MLTKTSLGPNQPRALDKKKAWVCASINQLAFPGAGTVMAGLWIGYLQAIIMIAGFVLTSFYFLALIQGAVQLIMNGALSEDELHAGYHHFLWTLKVGLLLTAVAWFWSLASSITIVRSVPKDPPVLS